MAEESSQAPDLAGEYAAARAASQELIDERARLSERLAQASGADFDADQFVAARERLDRLPVFILGAELRAQRLRVALLEEKLISEQETEQYQLAVTNEFYKRLQAAQAAYNEAVRDRDGARTQVMMLRGDLSAAKRELERVIRENSKPHAPVVRSLPHAFRAA